MQFSRISALCLILLCLFVSVVHSEENACLQCHAPKIEGFSAPHSFAADNCVACHRGQRAAVDKVAAHEGLIAFPGNLDNAQETCGGCHPDRVSSVQAGLMHTGHGIVDVTRRLVDGDSETATHANFQSLGHGPADSMMRKLCASCHLGQEKTEHRLDPMTDRGGGCLACHINEYPKESHPALTAAVSDGRCFGCHSRSGRISLSYAGLAEVERPDGADSKGLRLADGRKVEKMPADVHYRAGMACIDCHTATGVMGGGENAGHQRDAVDISCADCHANRGEGTALVTAKHGTVLKHMERRDDGLWLQGKTSGRKLKVPELGPGHAGFTVGHERLECATCHSQWAPQCFGCHMNYDEKGRQWDHIEKAETPGRWHEKRWDIRNGLAALGVNGQGKIDLFVPGMIMTLAHPDWEEEKFVRVFGPLSPHTTGRARSCESCHRSSSALGLGEGAVERRGEEFHFTPREGTLQDGLPIDAWTGLEGERGGDAPLEGQRPLSPEEMKAVLSAPLQD